jgi:hypothetical protein
LCVCVRVCVRVCERERGGVASSLICLNIRWVKLWVIVMYISIWRNTDTWLLLTWNLVTGNIVL